MADDFKIILDNFLEKHKIEDNLSAYARVTYKDEIIYEAAVGYADRENEIPITPESLFTLYSLSKPFCAIGIMKLKEMGLVDINLHPGRYLPEAMGFDPKLAIRQLLHHQSGVPDFVLNGEFHKRYASGFARDLRKHVEELTHYPMIFEPGTKYMYANVNFVLCALMIENVTGKSYREFMKKEVFEPLGMETAFVDSEVLSTDNRVRGYEMADGKIVCVDRDLNWMLGAGDVVAGAHDVYCLNQAIKHRKLLKQETWEEILTPPQKHFMGMGCLVTNWHDRYCIRHNGGSRGFRSLHIQLPKEDFDIIFLSNSPWCDLRMDFAEETFKAYWVDNCASTENYEMDKGYI